jgi:two-component system sensor histidine kinase CpxA
LTRAEGDPATLDMEVVRLDDLSQGLLDDCALEAQARGCRLVLHAEEPCSVLGERELLRWAVENVVRNAIRHAPESTPVEVRVEGGAGSVRITVRDHGPGVPEELLPHIFEPFFRVEGHRSRSSGGVGLGLAIARRAVTLHHGRITARNAAPGLAVAIDLPTTNAVAHASS